MVPDHDKEPKAAVAILARALGESETADAVPTVGRHSSEVLGNEILKYLECHDTAKLLHIHALRPGDGLTVARALGQVQKGYRRAAFDEDLEYEENRSAAAFVLASTRVHVDRSIAIGRSPSGYFAINSAVAPCICSDCVPHSDIRTIDALGPLLVFAILENEGIDGAACAIAAAVSTLTSAIIVVVDFPVERSADEFEETKVVFTVRIIVRRELAEPRDLRKGIGFDAIRQVMDSRRHHHLSAAKAAAKSIVKFSNAFRAHLRLPK
jgi:hypothetical protein